MPILLEFPAAGIATPGVDAPAAIEPFPVRYLAARAGAWVRSWPAESADPVRLVAYRARLHALDFFGDWTRVTRRSPRRVAALPEGRRGLGWIPSALLSDAAPPALPWKATVDAPAGLDVRFDPSLDSRHSGILSHGAAVTVITNAGPWARLDAPIPGWVLECFLQKAVRRVAKT